MTDLKPAAKKKSSSSSKKIDLAGIFSLTKMTKKTLEVSTETVDTLTAMATRLNRGRESGALEISDVLTSALFQIGDKGISIKPTKLSNSDLELSMPSDAIAILAALATKNGASEAEVIEEIAKRL